MVPTMNMQQINTYLIIDADLLNCSSSIGWLRFRWGEGDLFRLWPNGKR